MLWRQLFFFSILSRLPAMSSGTRSLCVRLSRQARFCATVMGGCCGSLGFFSSDTVSDSSSSSSPRVSPTKLGPVESRSSFEEWVGLFLADSQKRAPRRSMSVSSTKSTHCSPHSRMICSSENSEWVRLTKTSSRPPGLSPFCFFSRSNYSERKEKMIIFTS